LTGLALVPAAPRRGFLTLGSATPPACPIDWRVSTREGHYNMPARPLTAAQVGDLLAYIQRNGGTE